MGDKGFQGLERIGIISAFADDQSDRVLQSWNWMVKKYRIVVENVISEMKRWKILHTEWHAGSKLPDICASLKYHTMIVQVVAGLVNLYSLPRRNAEFFENVRAPLINTCKLYVEVHGNGISWVGLYGNCGTPM